MRKFWGLFLLVLLAVLLQAVAHAEDSVTANITDLSMIGPEARKITITIKTTKSWEVSCIFANGTFNKQSGKGNGTVTFSLLENKTSNISYYHLIGIVDAKTKGTIGAAQFVQMSQQQLSQWNARCRCGTKRSMCISLAGYPSGTQKAVAALNSTMDKVAPTKHALVGNASEINCTNCGLEMTGLYMLGGVYETSDRYYGTENHTFSGDKCTTCGYTKVSIPAKKIKLDKASVSLGDNVNLKLNATLTPSNATSTITWSSNKPGVVTVDQNGVLERMSQGTATITAKTSNGLKATCKVTVPPLTLAVVPRATVPLSWLTEKYGLPSTGIQWSVTNPTGYPLVGLDRFSIVNNGLLHLGPNAKKGSKFKLVAIYSVGDTQVRNIIEGRVVAQPEVECNRFSEYNYLNGYVEMSQGQSPVVIQVWLRPNLKDIYSKLTINSSNTRVVTLATNKDGDTVVVPNGAGFAHVFATYDFGAPVPARFALTAEVKPNKEDNLTPLSNVVRYPSRYDAAFANFCLTANQLTRTKYSTDARTHYLTAGLTMSGDVIETPQTTVAGSTVKYGPRYSVAWGEVANKKTIMISIRGTEKDWNTDFKFWTFGSDGTHAGFRGYAAIMQKKESGIKVFAGGVMLSDVIKEISAMPEHKAIEKYQFILTGHSLGGAVGYAYADMLMDAGIPKDCILVYTMGCPNPFDISKFYKWKSCYAFNVINQQDPVPQLGAGIVGGHRPGKDLVATYGDKADFFIGLSNYGWLWTHDPAVYRTACYTAIP